MAEEKGEDRIYGIVVLAAGNSSRLGRPKQLLSYQGQTLLEHSINTAVDSSIGQVVVVLGANAENIYKQVDKKDVHYVVNENWREGMASSIRTGVNRVLQICSSPDGLILMVCDQPFVTATLLKELITTHLKSGKPIISCSYADTLGTPAFFHHNLFPDLLQLKGEKGAKSILQQHSNNVEVIPFAEGSFDIDTEADFERINNNYGL